MDTVIGLPYSKIFLAYRTPWWETLKLTKISGGKTNTTLPLQQSYYFGKEKTIALFLASYNDDPDYSYWRSYFTHNYFNETNPESTAFYVTPLPSVMLNDLNKQISLVHAETIPPAIYSVYMNWGQNPYGAAVHLWRAHTRPWEVSPYMRHPFKDLPIYIVGEAYSNQQSWIEGALNSAEKMLQENFGMARASWIPADYDLGD